MGELYLIRHGKTYGNSLGRYIGTTDEELTPQGREELLQRKESGFYGFLRPDLVFVSPLRRCVQTAELLFPGAPLHLCPKLRECDFGEFENRNYQELSDHPAYQAWVDSGGTLPFPGGESREAFQARCREGFAEALAGIGPDEAQPAGSRESAGLSAMRPAFVVHGGTMMSILSAYGDPPGDFYRWQVKNGEGFRACWERTDEGGIRLYEISHIGPDSGLPA